MCVCMFNLLVVLGVGLMEPIEHHLPLCLIACGMYYVIYTWFITSCLLCKQAVSLGWVVFMMIPDGAGGNSDDQSIVL